MGRGAGAPTGRPAPCADARVTNPNSAAPAANITIKHFVYEAVEEALKLEKALARLQPEQKIAVLHYAPIQATVQGEPEPIHPFLGSSRLEEPLNRYAVTAVFHGHAHHGSPEGRTRDGVPVYNVALHVLRDAFGEQTLFRILEVPVTMPAEPAGAAQR